MATLGFSDSDSGSNSSFNEFLSPDQLPYLQDMWSNLGSMFQMFAPFMQQSAGAGTDMMGDTLNTIDPYWNDMLGGGVYEGMDLQSDYDAAFQNLLNPSTYQRDLYTDIMGGEGNDYVDALGGMMREISDESLGRSLATLDQRAGLMSGSSGWENAMGDIISDSDRDLNAALYGLGYETFDQDLQNKLDIAGMADTNWLNAATNAMNTAAGSLAAEQGVNTGALDFGGDLWNAGLTQMMLPMQLMSMFSNMFNPITLGEGSSTSSSDSTGFGFGF